MILSRAARTISQLHPKGTRRFSSTISTNGRYSSSSISTEGAPSARSGGPTTPSTPIHQVRNAGTLQTPVEAENSYYPYVFAGTIAATGLAFAFVGVEETPDKNVGK